MHPAEAGTQALSSPQVSDRAPVSSASLAVAQTWVPAFAGMHGWGRGPRLAKMYGWGDGGGIRIQKMRYFNTVTEKTFKNSAIEHVVRASRH